MAGDGGLDDGWVLTFWTIHRVDGDVYCVQIADVVRGLHEPVVRANMLGPFVGLEVARACVPSGLVRTERMVGDEASVVETWL